MPIPEMSAAARISLVAPVAPTVPSRTSQTAVEDTTFGVNPGDAVQGGLRLKTARSGAVTLVAQGFKVAVRIGSMMILARLLAPEDFGLQGMVLVVTGFVSLFKDAGLGMATVQRQTITHEQTSTLFWINAALGLALTTALVAAAPALATFFREPRLTPIIAVAAVGFIISGLCVQHQALLQRKLRFVALAVVDISAILASTAVGISMALSGYGYWALIGMAVSLPAVTAVGLWIAMPWMPGLPRRGQGIRSMLHLGGAWTFVGLASYAAYNFEKMLLGRYWGAVPLGLYGRAYQLISLPTDLMSSLGSVAISALSRLQQDPEKLRRAFVACYSLIVSLTIPIALVCAVSSEEIVAVVLGPQWSAAAPLLRALAPTTLGFAMMFPLAWILTATARYRVSIGTTLLVPPVIILGILVGIRYGTTGVALGYSAGVCLVAVPVIIWCCSASGIPMRALWGAIRQPLWAGILAAGCTLGVKIATLGVLPPLLMLVSQAGVMLAIYGWMLLVVFGRKDYYLDVLGWSRSDSTEALATPVSGRS